MNGPSRKSNRSEHYLDSPPTTPDPNAPAKDRAVGGCPFMTPPESLPGMLRETVIDPAFVSEVLPVSPALVALSTELLLAVAEELCNVADSLKEFEVDEA